MCGIAGILNLDQKKIDSSVLENMSKSIAHRGPDDDGIFLNDNIGLAHRRLSIIDISKMAAQPMQSNIGNWVIVFNGCIYNYLDLKADLIKKGHSFKSTSDTEVIVEGLEQYGTEFFEQLNGMFAVAAWNKKTSELYLSRDRYGVKPLYYWQGKNKFVFASEIKAILQHPDYNVSVNHSVLNEYFSFQNTFRYETLFDQIHMLPPANTVKISSEKPELRHNSWWDYNFSTTDETLSFEDAVNETERLMEQAVQRQLVSDVPVGSYLSGGMDSGSITSIASKNIPRISTFTAGFDMNEVTGREANFDERRDAELMASVFGTEHYEQVINANDLSWSLPRVVWHLEDLRVGMSYPNYYISRLASKFVKVCLQGTGGDELFGGYPWRYYRVFNSIDQDEFFQQYYQFWQRLVPDNQKSNLFNDSTLKRVNIEESRAIFNRVFLFNPQLKYNTAEDHINNSLYFEIKTFLHGLLIVGDKLSMANGLEERFPFLDNDLVNFAQKIPVRHKLANLENMKRLDENTLNKRQSAYLNYDDGKNVLRNAMKHFLPEKIINRNKQGFSAPDESWYRGKNAAYIDDLLLNKNARSSEFINQSYIKHILDEHNKGVNHRLLIWSFINFEWWCRLFLNGEKIDSI